MNHTPFNLLTPDEGRDHHSSNSTPRKHCRLLYLIGELHTGGSEWQLYQLLRAMDRKRYSPAVVVWNYSENAIHLPLIRALEVPVYSLFREGPRFAKLMALRSLVERLQPEVVHSWSFYTNFAASYATLGTRSIAIGSIRSDFSWAIRECGWLLGSLSALWPRKQICNSYSAAEYVRSLSGYFAPTQISVVRNGIDLEQFGNSVVPNNEPTLILGVGYLLPVKRWERLLRAAQQLKKKDINFLAKIAGDGPLRSELEKEVVELGIGEQVQFLGHIQDISRLMAEASFVVHTADAEGCPNAVMEAMACGRAVVATDAGDIRALIDDGESGFIVPVDNVEALVDRIVRLLTDFELCKSMGQAARAKAERVFGVNCLVTETLAAYSSWGWRDDSVQ